MTAYVKLTEDSRKIIAELAAAQVGRALGLNVPKPYLVLVDTNELPEEFQSAFSNKGYMLCFASKQVSERSYSLERSLRGRDPQTNMTIAKLFDMNTTVAFDELVANTDRNLGNLIYSPERKGVWMIDHGQALTGVYWDLWGLVPDHYASNTVADSNSHAWDEARRRAVLAAAQKMVLACAELSLDDLDKEGHYSRIDTGTDRQQIAEFLKERIHHTVPLLCKRLQIDQLPLAQPPRT
ncbi:HipA family kinase [Pseudomonas mosselii]|uniref:HipA family kinase n=1 Tax=Pseudomonas mosselii TaxID=78327 RepID=UPI0021D9EE74|nr:HipA family kinase [Pseudomonas mosselii]MCU9541741.1 hypothetical protein [Pseudomonas mosselii]